MPIKGWVVLFCKVVVCAASGKIEAKSKIRLTSVVAARLFFIKYDYNINKNDRQNVIGK